MLRKNSSNVVTLQYQDLYNQFCRGQAVEVHGLMLVDACAQVDLVAVGGGKELPGWASTHWNFGKVPLTTQGDGLGLAHGIFVFTVLAHG
jgi:hypothetical protein